jgi:hypothetical protein
MNLKTVVSDIHYLTSGNRINSFGGIVNSFDTAFDTMVFSDDMRQELLRLITFLESVEADKYSLIYINIGADGNDKYEIVPGFLNYEKKQPILCIWISPATQKTTFDLPSKITLMQFKTILPYIDTPEFPFYQNLGKLFEIHGSKIILCNGLKFRLHCGADLIRMFHIEQMNFTCKDYPPAMVLNYSSYMPAIPVHFAMTWRPDLFEYSDRWNEIVEKQCEFEKGSRISTNPAKQMYQIKARLSKGDIDDVRKDIINFCTRMRLNFVYLGNKSNEELVREYPEFIPLLKNPLEIL